MPVKKTRLLAIAMLAASAASGSPDVIRLVNGSIYLGKIASAGEAGVSVEAFGTTTNVSPGQILRTETGMGSLAQDPVELHLKDGSVIRGKITDYDPDIGLLVDIEFGTLTVPYESLSSVEDPKQRSAYRGQPWMIEASGAWYWPLGSFSSSFSSNGWLSLATGVNLPWVRGLYAGVDTAYWFMGYLPSTQIDYYMVTAAAAVSYQLLLLRSSRIPVIKDLVPWASLELGVAWVGVRDGRPGAVPAAYGELDPALGTVVGIDWHIGPHFLARLEGRYVAVPQSASLLHLIGVGIGVGYGL